MVKRNTSPRFQFIILNRLSPKNHVEDVLDSFDLEIHAPYLIYKNHKHEVLGVWFYDESDLQRTYDLLTKLSATHGGGAPAPRRKKGGEAAGTEPPPGAQSSGSGRRSRKSGAKASPSPGAPIPAPVEDAIKSPKTRAAEDISNLIGLKDDLGCR